MIQAAKILEQRSHLVPGKLRITEHFFQVPRDYKNPSLGNLTLFARSARKVENHLEKAPEKPLPWLVYLQGGPGFECASPEKQPWINFVLNKGYQVLTLDQRGTGFSTAISQSSLQLRGDEKVQTEYLKAFRADNIVRDCEAIRKALIADVSPSSTDAGDDSEESKKWSIMGQSFGGFCCTTYLSFYPEGVKEAFILGGLPPVRDTPDDVYARTYGRVRRRNEAYYAKYPEDVDRVRRIVKFLTRFGDTTVRVQGGEGYLSARRFLLLGLQLYGHGGMDILHDLVLRADTDLTSFGHLTRPTVLAIEHAQSWDTNVLYFLLHEPCYCQNAAANWSADRLLAANPDFIPSDQHASTTATDDAKTVLFTGEMIYPHMFESFPELKKMQLVGEALAKVDDWPRLYDEEQLAKNEVPVYAAVYMDDMCVDYDLSMERAAGIKGIKTFVTNTMYHNALRAKTEEVLGQLWRLKEDVID
ncbi:unnamed protein product [Periconia digitata]|uniref:Proline iminopeptidase n=1 Tax=Periconia digitata TaxID=1303443 RepID=A0A9W4XNU6_9PLEO|nr:unnamed protein product [Periconia digitata]